MPVKKRKSRKKARSRLRTSTAVWLFVMAIFFAAVGFHTWCRLLCTEEKVRITEGQKQRQALMQLQTKLKVELARLKSPARITAIARTRLGLRMPAPSQVIVLK
jgi:cell division protein FtsL